MVKNTLFLAVIIYCLSFSGCSIETQSKQSTVTVSGIGSVMVTPDMVQITINFSHTAATTREAKAEVDRRISQILSILKEEGIEEKDIKTISLSYDTATDYINGRTVVTGQRASQSMTVTIYNIAENPNRFPSMLDRITAIDRVSVRNIIFDTENKIEIYKQSRELAYEKALDKANQYAELSGRKLAKVLTISEGRNRDILLRTQSNVAYDEMVMPMSAGASVPTGEQEITTEITATFLMK